MRPPVPFTSAIGPTIARYVALKQALGRRFGTQRYLLARFDGFLAACHATDLTAETFSAWGSSIAHLMPSGRRMRMQMVRQFCLYRRRSDPACFVPDPSQFPPPQPRRRPHVFSEDEIARLLGTAGALRRWGASPLYRQVARLALVLLYTSGLRRGELVRLTLGDYDPVEHVLRVRDSKFYKSRLVPLSTDAVREIGRYLEDRSRPRFPSGADAPLLLHRGGSGLAAYSGNGLRVLMRHLFQTAGVRTASGHLPRVHDLRFTFALHALLRWYRTGADVQARLPALATYMGHVSILSIQYYLPILDTVALEASEKFERRCARFLAAALDERGGR
jgi:integrase